MVCAEAMPVADNRPSNRTRHENRLTNPTFIPIDSFIDVSHFLRETMVLMHTLAQSVAWRTFIITHYKSVALSRCWLNSHLPGRGLEKVFYQLLCTLQLSPIILLYDYLGINEQLCTFVG